MTNSKRPRSVLVTGAGGNLGSRTVARLVERDWCERVYCLDVHPMQGGVFDSPKCETIVTDLADPFEPAWQRAAAAAEAIAHFAVRNPLPDATWDETVAALDMTANLLERANPAGCRFVFASSNHTMGGYKDRDWTGLSLSARTPPLPGTRFFVGGAYHQPNMYGGSKLTTERLLRAKAIASGGTFTGVALRIGWCLPGDNDDPHRIDTVGGGTVSGGTGNEVQPAAEQARDLLWFRGMWLSHRDFQNQMEAALTADAAAWPAPAIVVNAVSANRHSLWDMEDAKTLLGHVPQDDVWTRLGLTPPPRA